MTAPWALLRHSSFPLATDLEPRTLSPRALAGPGAPAMLAAEIDVARPRPLVIDGDAAAWADAARSGAARALASAPTLTIGVVRGTATPDCSAALDACDLRAALGSEAATLTYSGDRVDDRVATWRSAFARAPQACCVAALVLRRTHDLTDEALAYSTLQAGDEFAAWLRAQVRSRAPDAPAAPSPWDRDVAYAGSAVTVLADPRYREVVLTRPHRHNALDAVMRAELCDVLATLPDDAPVVLRGIGPSFCSGGDLDEFGLLADPADAFFARTAWSVAELVRRMRGRLVVALHGACVGAGIELAAFASRVIAARSTRIRLPEAEFGLIPGSGGTVSLPARIGAHRTLDLVVTSRWVGADEARGLGLVDEVVSDDDLVSVARAAALELAP